MVEELLAPPSGPTLLLSAMGDITGFAHQDLSVSPPQQMFTNPTSTPSSMDFEQNTPTTVLRATNGSKPFGAISTNAGISWIGFATMLTQVPITIWYRRNRQKSPT